MNTEDINKCRTHLDPFKRSYLPPEAFSYQRLMTLYGLNKADAKRMVQRVKQEQVFLNDTYQVNMQAVDGGVYIHLSIKRRDRATVHDWRDMQAIKNMLVGPEHEAIELYPAESRLVDTANQYHLWALKTTTRRFPVGFDERLVMDYDEHREDGSVQRPLPPDVQPGKHIPGDLDATTEQPASIPEDTEE
jgi:hypothetical protein